MRKPYLSDSKKNSPALNNIKTNKIQDSVISIYQLRTYTLLQLRKILKNVPELEIINAYDEYYDLSNPISLNSGSDYAVLLLRKN